MTRTSPNDVAGLVEAIKRLRFNADFQRGYGDDRFSMRRDDADLILAALSPAPLAQEGELRAVCEAVVAVSRGGEDTISFLIELNRIAKMATAALASPPPACDVITREQAAQIAESHAAPKGMPQIDYDRACHDIAEALRNADGSSPVDAGFVLVPREPTEAQWDGLARSIMMWLDMEPRTPRALFKHLERSGREIPVWLRNEPEMRSLDHVPSKGTRCVLIYRAMVEDAMLAASENRHDG